MKKKYGKFYDIMTTEGSNEATIFIYGYIGEQWESMDGASWQQTGVTDIDFVKELDELSAKYSIINIRINSFGGEIFHGMAIVNAMQRCQAEIHTYIDGLAASMAGSIWLAGKHRHMAKNALLMLHASGNICWGNAADMREMATLLDQFTKTLVLGIADSTGGSAEEISAKYFDDYKDHWLTHDQVSAETNFITAPDDYQAADTGITAALKDMTYQQLVAHFKEKDSPKGQTIMQQVRAAFAEIRAAIIPPAPAQAAIQSPTNNKDMNFDEFKASIKDGTLSLDQVKAHVLSLQSEPDETPREEDESEVIKELKAVKDEMKTLRAEFSAYKAAPGATKSEPGMPEKDPATAEGQQNPLTDFNQQMAAAAKSGDNPMKRKG